jgi:single-strand DNA-binding protein
MSVNETYLQVHGRVGTDVTYKESQTGIPMASFRLGTTPRKYNRTEQRWEDKATAWFTVECWRGLAQNVQASVQKGQAVFVTGRLKTREWVDESGEKHSRSTYIDAQSVGHDLNWGTATFRKNERSATQQQSESVDDEMDALSERLEGLEDAADAEPAGVALRSSGSFLGGDATSTESEVRRVA